MIYPDQYPRHLSSRHLIALALMLAPLLAACGGKVISKPAIEPGSKQTVKENPSSLPNWLGNPGRNFYGTGPWQEGPLEIVWERGTDFITGRLHKELWGGTSWPGQPSVDGSRVYFPSADGNIYCLNSQDGSVIWKFQAKDSFKATPALAGDRIIANGLDHHIYCLNGADGALLGITKRVLKLTALPA